MKTDTHPTTLPFLHPVSLLATWFGAGKSPKAPGTVGTLAAMPFAYAILVLGGSHALLVAALLLFLIGVAVSEKYMRANGTEQDPGEIVIDEVAGVWLLMVAFPPTLNGLIFGFALFRLFDVLKPWPVSLCDNKVLGGFGVMLDDFAAAMYPVFLIGIAAVVCGLTGSPMVSDLFVLLGQNGI
jgi:phosphatidylglycerophosphatase A